MRFAILAVAAIWLATAAAGAGEEPTATVQTADDSIPGEVKRSADALDKALTGAKTAVVKELGQSKKELSETRKALEGMRTKHSADLKNMREQHGTELKQINGQVEAKQKEVEEKRKELEAYKSDTGATIASLEEEVKGAPAKKEAARKQLEMAAAAHVLVKGLAKGKVPNNCWFLGFLRPECKLANVSSVVAEAETLLDVPGIVAQAQIALNASELVLAEAKTVLAQAEMKACPTFTHQQFIEACYTQLVADTELVREMCSININTTHRGRLYARWELQATLSDGPRYMYVMVLALYASTAFGFSMVAKALTQSFGLLWFLVCSPLLVLKFLLRVFFALIGLLGPLAWPIRWLISKSVRFLLMIGIFRRYFQSHLMPQFQAKAEALKANIILQVSKGNLEGKNFKKQVKVVSKACRAPLLP